MYIFGNDYETHDGTGVRDYLHIEDLGICFNNSASGHLAALTKMETMTTSYDVFNLGTGKGLSVYDIISGF